MQKDESTSILGQFATNGPVFRASGASVIHPQQDQCKGSPKEDADLTTLESDSNSLLDSSSESESDNVSPQLIAPIRNRTTQVIPSWSIADIAEEYCGNSTMPQYNPNNKIDLRSTISQKKLKKEIKIRIQQQE